MTKETEKVLWTGGWDSTFMLLKLLLIDKKTVEPIYLIDPERRSIRNEFLAMRKLKELTLLQFPEAKKRFLPTQYYAISDFNIDETIKKTAKGYRETCKLGRQYTWLASFCKHKNLSDVHMGIIKGGRIDNLNKNESQTSEFKTVFKYYNFSIIHLTKNDILQKSKEYGWFEIMTHTWFCHKPTRKGKTCGRCNPCKDIKRDKLNWRFSKKFFFK